jgi:pimeloyl-ACP methyl ester carboxylesterase
MGSRTEIILVHGLWFGAWALGTLGRRLHGMGFPIRHFDYAATADHLDRHARELHRLALEEEMDRRHFLGHSLGGLVILRMLAEFDDIPPGRVVLLGSPLGGSSVARKMNKMPGAEKLLGKARAPLQQGYAELPADRETGMITGSKAVGLGLLAGGPGGPSDGTVGIGEADAKGLKDRLVLPVTHTGLLYSAEVAQQAAAFLHNGRFEPVRQQI